MSALVTLSDLAAAASRIRPTARVTPLIDVPWPSGGSEDPPLPVARRGGSSDPPGHRLWLKCESLQPMGAFKIRGAINMLAQLSSDDLARGVITYSSGNHGQAVALAAQERGAPAVIVMPTTAPAIKVEGARSYGAEVLFAGTTSTDRKTRAEQEAAARGLTMVPPFDHPWIIAGQGTAGLEILDQAPDVGTVFVPMGGGGLIAGVAAALKLSNPHVRVVGVEPEGAPKMTRSLEAGHPVTLERTASIADGLLPIRPGDLTFAHVQAFVDATVTVGDEQIARAVAWLARHARLVVEPSGAVTVAAVAAGLGDADPARGAVVALISGGNVEPAAYARYVQA